MKRSIDDSPALWTAVFITIVFGGGILGFAALISGCKPKPTTGDGLELSVHSHKDLLYHQGNLVRLIPSGATGIVDSYDGGNFVRVWTHSPRSGALDWSDLLLFTVEKIAANSAVKPK